MFAMLVVLGWAIRGFDQEQNLWRIVGRWIALLLAAIVLVITLMSSLPLVD